MLRNKTIFITGGAGFIGTRLAQHLGQDNRIMLFDNLSRNSFQDSDVRDNQNVQLVSGDVLDYAAVKSTMKGADVVVHAAAIAGIDTVIKDPVKTMEVNMLGTANVLRAAHENGVRDRVVDFSTSEVFGSMAYRVSEDSSAVSGSAGEARWVYAVSKLAGEHLAQAYYKQHKLPTVTIRPFNVYGPGQTGEGAMHIFVCKALHDEDITIFGDGSQIRAWCYIDDLVDGLTLALERPEAVGQSFNIGNARAITTIFGLAGIVCRVLHSKSKIVFRAPLSADIELRIPETKKAKEMLNFQAKVDLEEGILKTAVWYRKF